MKAGPATYTIRYTLSAANDGGSAGEESGDDLPQTSRNILLE